MNGTKQGDYPYDPTSQACHSNMLAFRKSLTLDQASLLIGLAFQFAKEYQS